MDKMQSNLSKKRIFVLTLAVALLALSILGIAFQMYQFAKNAEAAAGTLNINPSGMSTLPGNSGFTSTGRLGIGTTNPANPLSVSTQAQGMTSIINTTAGNIGIENYYAGSSLSTIDFKNSSAGGGPATGNPISRIGSLNTSSGSWLLFGTSNNYASGITTANAAMKYNGNMGIGTTNPRTRLDVAGGYGRMLDDGSNVPPSGGQGLELASISGNSYVLSYNRDGSAYMPLWVGASSTNFNAGPLIVSAGAISASGTGTFGSYAVIGSNIAAGYYQDATNGAYRALNGASPAGYYFQSYNGAATSMYVGLAGTYANRVGIGGNVTPAYNLDVTGTANVSSTLNVNGITDSAGTRMDAAGGWLRTYGATGWYNGTYAGGWYMQDASYIRSYNTRYVYIDNNLYAPIMYDQNDANYYVDPNGTSSFTYLKFGNNAATSIANVSGYLTLEGVGTYGGVGGVKFCAGSVGGCGTSLAFISSLGDVIAKGAVTPNGNPDVAENIPITDTSIESGDVVSADTPDTSNASIYEHARAKKASKPYDPTLIGIISTDPAILLNNGGDATGRHIYADKRFLTLTGRVPLKVSTVNGPIHTGDYLTSSSIPGVAMRATEPGPTIAKALEDFNSPNVGKIMAQANYAWYDPDVTLSTTGDIKITGSNNEYKVQKNDGSVVTRVAMFAESVIGHLKSGLIEAQKVVINGVDVMQKMNSMEKTIQDQQTEIDSLKNAVKELQNK